MAAEPLTGARVALVTGAAGPAGRAICAALASAGWHVAGADRRGSGAALALDATDGGEVRAAVVELERVHGAVELLVTTTGDAAAGEPSLAFDAIAPDAWGQALADQLRMTVHCARAVLPGMLENGRGQIVAVTSAAALDGGEHEAHRASADGAVIGLVKALAREYGPQGIAVNTLAPGEIAPEQVAASVAFLAREPHYFAGQVLCPSAGRIL
jgi:3-oxoacyl-[acyl-carrier protein] reductase